MVCVAYGKPVGQLVFVVYHLRVIPPLFYINAETVIAAIEKLLLMLIGNIHLSNFKMY